MNKLATALQSILDLWDEDGTTSGTVTVGNEELELTYIEIQIAIQQLLNGSEV